MEGRKVGWGYHGILFMPYLHHLFGDHPIAIIRLRLWRVRTGFIYNRQSRLDKVMLRSLIKGVLKLISQLIHIRSGHSCRKGWDTLHLVDRRATGQVKVEDMPSYHQVRQRRVRLHLRKDKVDRPKWREVPISFENKEFRDDVIL